MITVDVPDQAGTPLPALGLLYVPVIHGQPTSTPDMHNGFVPVAFDDVNMKLWIYAGAWVSTPAS